jgi:gas vesicle protein
MNKKGLGKFVIGAAIGAGLGVLFAPKKGSELRKDLKVKLDDLMTQVKKIDIEEVKAEFDAKVEEIKTELSDLDREKALAIAKEKGNELKKKAEELVDLAKKKGTPVLINSAQDVLENVVKVSKDAIKKLESKKEAE